MIKQTPHRVDYYVMPSPPKKIELPLLETGYTIEQVHKVSVDCYREVFDLIGGPWHWTSRKIMSDEELACVLHHSENRLWFMRHGQTIMGMVELNNRHSPVIEISYFGLSPHYIGRGYGKSLMKFALYQCWQELKAQKVWLHTCEFDHPRAGAFYRSSGFLFERSQIETSAIAIYPHKSL